MYTHGVSFLDLIDPTRAATALASVKHCIVTGLPGHPENEVHAMKRQTKRPQDELEAPVKDHRQNFSASGIKRLGWAQGSAATRQSRGERERERTR